MLIKDLILSLDITKEEHEYFVRSCGNWAGYCEFISNLNRYELMKLLKYLVEERPYSKLLLTRAIGKFNKLNKLERRYLIDEKTNTTGGNSKGDKETDSKENGGG